MLTPDQEKWIAHLSDQDHIEIAPFDATAQDKFEVVKNKIQSALGSHIRVEHRGSTSLGISGQDEIDVYIPVPENQFDSFLAPLITLFDNPRSHYPLDRARFVTFEEGKHIDVFLISDSSEGWLNGIKFEDYLKSHPEALQSYRSLKEDCQGLNTREYYRRKIEFINEILSDANQA